MVVGGNLMVSVTPPDTRGTILSALVPPKAATARFSPGVGMDMVRIPPKRPHTK